MDPEIIVLGGGMAAAGALLLDSVERHFREQYWKLGSPRAKIRIAEVGNDAGFIGAALLARETATPLRPHRRIDSGAETMAASLHENSIHTSQI